MKFHDVLLRVNSKPVWIADIYEDDADAAIARAIEMAGGAYLGHQTYEVVDGEWKMTAENISAAAREKLLNVAQAV